jgi:cytochrome oxidase Cu insertion factor (SCO1/SenC/PrrC family)
MLSGCTPRQALKSALNAAQLQRRRQAHGPQNPATLREMPLLKPISFFMRAVMRVLMRGCLAGVLLASVTVAQAGALLTGSGPWVDQRSLPLDADSLLGRHVVVSMAYGACRRICTTSLRLMEQLQQLADQRGLALDFVVVGLDPAEDRPADWAALQRERGLERRNWHFLSGSVQASRAVAARLGVSIWRIDSHLMHDFKIVLLSPTGAPLRSIDRFDQPLSTLLP